ncbi:hypothetical protein L211DRAFT_524697 [Terfezia boudieri ATCC MYA-4762]|uniref:Uncharacterized protein n=1 Tax=Terfezia boudieri ATCC MYA-4762 TaxID=1051890 RepID=A0A3N4LBW3_9PEZI|nr:hypothetical protein L211DRAFT_524697 [Terfezia boudieri ATCC MYA-4762]
MSSIRRLIRLRSTSATIHSTTFSTIYYTMTNHNSQQYATLSTKPGQKLKALETVNPSWNHGSRYSIENDAELRVQK